MKAKAFFGCLFAAALLAPVKADACTNIIVTRGASADGSNIVSYAADSHYLYGELYFHPAQNWKAGSMLRVTDWDSQRILGEIPQVEHTYQTVGNMNEHQLIIAETTFGGREELVDGLGKMDYGSMIYIALQRARTAREAIKVMTELANEYGYVSEGETFSIVDKEEAWIMEVVGKGMNIRNGVNRNKGILWVARRIPDGYICAHANQARITTFPLNDPENCLYAPDVIDFARNRGWFDGNDADFSFADAYCPLDFSGARACEARVWSAFNILSSGWFIFRDARGRKITHDAYSYLDHVMGYNPSIRLPLFIEPVAKISVKQVADAMRDHYEGTPMDMTADVGAGGNALPYRWRPMHFEVEGKTYLNERAIATQQTGFWFVAQARQDLPDVIGALIWFSTDDAATSCLTPIYVSTNKVPECFREGNGDLLHYSETSSFWLNNRVANACYKMYNIMAPTVRERIDAFEKAQAKEVARTDSAALAAYRVEMQKAREKAAKSTKAAKAPTFAAIRKQLTDFSVNTAQGLFEQWKALEVELLLKYMDGNVKPQNPDGSFKHSEFSDKVPERVEWPGYTEHWKQAVADERGGELEVRK